MEAVNCVTKILWYLFGVPVIKTIWISFITGPPITAEHILISVSYQSIVSWRDVAAQSLLNPLAPLRWDLVNLAGCTRLPGDHSGKIRRRVEVNYLSWSGSTQSSSSSKHLVWEFKLKSLLWSASSVKQWVNYKEDWEYKKKVQVISKDTMKICIYWYPWRIMPRLCKVLD